MYWDKKGSDCTADTVHLTLQAAKEKNIKYIVVASNTGATAELFANKGLEVVCVTHVNGFVNPGENEMSAESRSSLEALNIKVLTTAHALSGAERAFSSKFGGIYPIEIVANTLRMFGQGVKVGVEIATMALDAGLIPFGESIIAVGGSVRGADSAIILKPSHAKDILSTRIEEILCKPR
ncbi:MAG TPA: pyruvate kinase alpha/beta domain-containing protein [Patescibacteria group bacterium]|nr:pyruvate kinase alpha/beta domain-containing protein [Patescibacteria group bacterium]